MRNLGIAFPEKPLRRAPAHPARVVPEPRADGGRARAPARASPTTRLRDMVRFEDEAWWHEAIDWERSTGGAHPERALRQLGAPRLRARHARASRSTWCTAPSRNPLRRPLAARAAGRRRHAHDPQERRRGAACCGRSASGRCWSSPSTRTRPAASACSSTSSACRRAPTAGMARIALRDGRADRAGVHRARGSVAPVIGCTCCPSSRSSRPGTSSRTSAATRSASPRIFEDMVRQLSGAVALDAQALEDPSARRDARSTRPEPMRRVRRRGNASAPRKKPAPTARPGAATGGASSSAGRERASKPAARRTARGRTTAASAALVQEIARLRHHEARTRPSRAFSRSGTGSRRLSDPDCRVGIPLAAYRVGVISACSVAGRPG